MPLSIHTLARRRPRTHIGVDYTCKKYVSDSSLIPKCCHTSLAHFRDVLSRITIMRFHNSIPAFGSLCPLGHHPPCRRPVQHLVNLNSPGLDLPLELR